MLTTEQLLYPRYKVAAPWPGMEAEPFRLQQIVTLLPSDDGFIHIPIKHIPGSYMRQGFFDMFPHLFQPLPWWSDREISDMPEYVKEGAVIHPVEWRKENESMTMAIEGVEWYVVPKVMIFYQPASLEQYNQQKEGNRE